jgi:hypothetical protein
VVSARCGGTGHPRPELARLRKTKDPSFRKHTWPRFGGAFSCVEALGNHLPRSRICFGAEEDLSQHDETKLKASLRRGFFCTEKGALNSSLKSPQSLEIQDPEVLLLVGGVAELRATRWCAERSQRKAPRRGRGLGGWRETLEGSCLTFTPNTTALHSVPMARRGRAYAYAYGCPKNCTHCYRRSGA